MKRTLTALSLLLALSAASAQTLTVGLDADPPRLDPALSTAFVDRQVMNQIFDKLVDVNENLKIVPMVAKSWKVTNGGLTYTFKLNTGIRFSDGTPLDAAAVKYSIERNMTLDGSARKGELGSVKDVAAPDAATVVITLKAPYGPLLAVLSDRSGMIVSPTAAKKAGADFASGPVGSGPFTFVSRKRQDNITLKANTGYWRGKPSLDTLVYRPFPDGDVRVANLLSGAVQVITPVDPKDIATIQKNPKLDVDTFQGLGFQGVWMNVTRPPFNSKLVRQAFSATVERDAINKVVFLNTVKPAAGPFPPGTPAYSAAIKAPQGDVALARKKLAQAGKANVSFTLLTSPGAVNAQLAQLYQAMAAQAGFTVKIETVEFGTLLDRADRRNYDAVMLGWSGRPDPDGNIYDFFHTGGSNNQAGYSDPGIDALLEKARAQNAMSARVATYNVALGKILDDAPYVFTYFSSNTVGVSKSLTGLKLVPDGILRFSTADLK
ncbi:ABC transporter substrate-binding protein [Deinococcus aquiradiocola]|uniref:ABC transporter substrate-binding protein n=1 Tax=Deinococcus aquiradiocola TaxID=393059 RepID=A0A917UMV6_9DEIO|nr:ABC transporter substrate-binding protein [Deinococcus aquiradiocola]GGJ69188.1 ABC transporter substrate-binding protein [Deinococcus aquiradiocola]